MKKGFTIIELLVSIGIFTIITGAVIVNFRLGERSNELRISSEQLATKIRSAQVMAQTGRAIDGSVPQGGFGISTSVGSRQVILYADFFDGSTEHLYDASSGEEIANEGMMLPQNVVVDRILNDGTEGDDIDILFSPPNADVWVDGEQSVLESRIVIRHTVSGRERTIIVRRVSGRISSE